MRGAPLAPGIAALSVTAVSGAIEQTTAGTSLPAISMAPSSQAVDLMKALAWPMVALLIAAVFRKPISVFVSALGTRITKLSLFKVELELVPAMAATTTPLLDDIGTAANSAAISDSSKLMLEQVQSGTPADFAAVALGSGNEWLTSRLYIAAVMMERMRDVKVFVFLERSPTSERRLLAVAPVRQLRWALAIRYPWLEASWARVQLSLFPQAAPANAPPLPTGAQWLPDPRSSPTQSVIKSDTGAFEPWQARQLVSGFIESLQRPLPKDQSSSSREWVTLPGGVTQERAAYVTRELLTSLLRQEAFESWANALRDAPRSQRTRAVLRCVAPFVALVEGDHEFARLANRKTLLEEIAASLGEEPEGASR
jgi:hypothetical protein